MYNSTGLNNMTPNKDQINVRRVRLSVLHNDLALLSFHSNNGAQNPYSNVYLQRQIPLELNIGK